MRGLGLQLELQEDSIISSMERPESWTERYQNWHLLALEVWEEGRSAVTESEVLFVSRGHANSAHASRLQFLA